MALIPTRYTYSQFPAPSTSEADWTETMGNMVVKRGYHVNPAKAGDEVLIESSKVIQNFKGTPIQEVADEWTIERHGAPPSMHTRTTKSNAYLPALGGRAFRTVQVEETTYWTFTPLAGNNVENLAKTRTVSAYVVYDQPEDPTKATDGETTAALAEADVTAGPVRDRLFATGRLWSEANAKATVVPEEGHNQFTKWIDNVITETDLVDEEWDRWIMVTITKNALRPGDVKTGEPREIKKPNIRYSLPVPLDPPKLVCTPLNEGVKCVASGGGCYLPRGRLNDPILIVPEKYRIYRATTSEPERTSTPDFADWWKDGEEPGERNRSVLENTAVTDLDGAPISPLPPTSGHTEPHDPEPPEPERDTYFELIATLDNEEPVEVRDRGTATHVDLDVVATGEYEYFATCTYGKDESEESNHEAVTYSGTEGRSYRMAVRVGVEEDEANGVQADHVDLIAPNEPALAAYDFGSVFEFEVPTSDDYTEVATEIGDRQFNQRQTPDVVVFDVLTPLLGLEYALQVGLPNVGWVTYSQDMVLASQTIANDYVLVGYSRELVRKADGSWGSPTTTLRMQEYPR